MLTVYRRHRKSCPNREDRYARRDRCACWVEGTVEGTYMRRSLRTRSWERAAELKGKLEAGPKPNLPEPPKIPTIEEAVDKFMVDAEQGRKLTAGTIKKYRVLLTQLKAFAASRAAIKLHNIDVDFARQFRSSWKDGPISSAKKLERLRAFLRFCMAAEWISSNPAASVSRPALRTPPTLPLSDKEIAKALEHAHDPRWRALILVLRWSGLRIGDAMKLSIDKLNGGKIFLRTAKTGTPVYVPLPDFVVNELNNLPRYGGYFFWNRAGESHCETAAGNARRALRRIFAAAGIKNAHPHRLRDSFAVGLLEKGVPIENVAMLLGHTDVRTTQTHYSPWVASRQQNLEKAVAATWAPPTLVRVK